VKKSSGTLYWYGPGGSVLAETDLSGNLIREFIYFNGQRIARRDSAGSIYYFFSDHLGTARVMTSATGVTQQESTYYPFGSEQRAITSTVDNRYRFTGLERDAETGLDHTQFRKYSPLQARWLSPDPVCSNCYDPQLLNRYTYVRNNPVNLFDRNGRDPASPWDQVWRNDPEEGGRWVTFVNWNYYRQSTLLVPARVDLAQIRQEMRDWWNRVNLGVNTSIGPDERNKILAAALAGIGSRVSGDCLTFLNNVISGLGGKLIGSIGTAWDLVSAGLKNAQYDTYAAVNVDDAHGRGNLTRRGFAFATTIGNTIHLGENFFDPSLPHSYNSQGGNTTATLIHEFFHLQAVSASGQQIKEADLDRAAGGKFGQGVRTNCVTR
jgi:RHS repeat-associated protein